MSKPRLPHLALKQQLPKPSINILTKQLQFQLLVLRQDIHNMFARVEAHIKIHLLLPKDIVSIKDDVPYVGSPIRIITKQR